MIRILYVDIRDNQQIMIVKDVEWKPNLTADQAVRLALADNIASKVIQDIDANDMQIGISWHDVPMTKHSGESGLRSLYWDIHDSSVLTILYDDPQATLELMQLSMDWMEENDPAPED